MGKSSLQLGDETRDDGRETSPLVAEIVPLLLVLLLLLAYVLSFWTSLNGSALRSGVLLGALAFAGCSAALAARRAPESVRVVWWTVPVFCLVLAASEGGRQLAGHLGAATGSRWFLAGALTLGAYSLLALAALRSLAGSSITAWSLGLIDSAMIAFVVSAPWYEMFVSSRIGDHGGFALLPQLAAPVAAAVALMLLWLSSRSASETEVPYFVLMAAIGAGFVGSVLLSRHLLAGGGMAPAHGALMAAALLIVVAAESTGRSAKARRSDRFSIGVVRMAVVLVAFVASLVYAGLAFRRGDLLGGVVVTSSVSLLLVARLLVQSLERHNHSAQLEQALREQEQLAVMDSLTGLYNRRFLDAELQLELDRSARSHAPVGVLLCDLDHFKQINDEHGHLVGDSVLREVARRLLNAVRNGDLVARYGGEEFVVLLPGGGKEKLREIGERCRRAFEEAPFQLPHDHNSFVTISIGGACWPDDANTPRGLVGAADAALYRAKAAGRNRILLSDAGAEEISPPFVQAAEPIWRPERALQSEASAALAPFLPETTESESERVSVEEAPDQVVPMERWAALVARALGLDENAQRRCALAARYHDIGKSSLPEAILEKNGPLSMIEWELVKEHPEMGATLVELTPELADVGRIIREHHERYDGRGYPEGKEKEEISTEARIIACCDAWQAMRSERAYAAARTPNEARAELLAGRGTQFDPEVVMAFLMFGEGDFEGAERVLDGLSARAGIELPKEY
jgi:diguanylate cyclase (GGDEF)-like protein/putative nucleotidyltransferase with HDIG domain